MLYYERRNGTRVYLKWRWLPLMLIWWAGVVYSWFSVCLVVWVWEIMGPAVVRSARTASRIFGWIE